MPSSRIGALPNARGTTGLEPGTSFQSATSSGVKLTVSPSGSNPFARKVPRINSIGMGMAAPLGLGRERSVHAP